MSLIPSRVTTVLDTNQNILVEGSLNKQKIKILLRIKELGYYQQDWYDGENGCPASRKAIRNAIIFAKNLDLNNICLPYISLAKDGEVNFWWDMETIKLDLGFYGDDTYSYYAKFDDGLELFEDEADYNSELPKEILERLQK